MSGTRSLKIRSVGAQGPLTATADQNAFANEPHAVAGICHREYQLLDAVRVPTQFGQVVEYEIPKDHDYHASKTQMFLTTAPATFTVPQVDEQFVEGVGYRMIELIELKLTNTQLCSAQTPYERTKINDLSFTDDRLVRLKEDNYLINKTVAALKAALAAGKLFTIDLFWGQSLGDTGRYLMVSALANNVKLKVTLAALNNIVQSKTANGANISNQSTLISAISFCHEAIHVPETERQRELMRYDTSDGLFTLVEHLETFDELIPINTGVSYSVNLDQLTGTYEWLAIIFRANNQVNLPWHGDPVFWTGPQFTFDNNAGGTDTFNFPDDIEFTIGANNPIFRRMSVNYNRTQYRHRIFPRSGGGDWTLYIHFSEFVYEDPAYNAVNGCVDFSVASGKKLNLYWNSGQKSSTTGVLHCRILAKGPEYLQKASGTASLTYR